MNIEEIINKIESLAAKRDSVPTQKQMAQETGIDELTFGRIIHRKLEVVPWRLKLKLLNWIQKNEGSDE